MQITKNPKLSDILRLPSSWYRLHIMYLRSTKKRAFKEEPPGFFSIVYFRFLAACYADRQYIDTIIQNDWFKNVENNSKLAEAYGDIGMTLCDLGYEDEGLEYLSRAHSVQNDTFWLVLLCLRPNSTNNYEKHFNRIQELALSDVDKMVYQAILGRAYMEMGQFSKASAIFEQLDEVYWFMKAELSVAQKQYASAIPIFEKYHPIEGMYFFRAKYDYKKALAYYHSGRIEKCQKQAYKMKRRRSWDKFYRFDNLESVGIITEPFIDDIINSGSRNRCTFDSLRITRCFKNLSYLIWGWIRRNPGLIVIILTILVFLLLCWLFPARRIHWQFA